MAFWNNWFRKKPTKRANIVEGSVLRSVNDTENETYFASARDRSADDICSAKERAELRAQCRKIMLDVPAAQHAARSLALSVYGPGPTLQIKSPDEHLNTSCERLYSLWRNQIQYDKLFFVALESLACDGEAFFNLISDPNVIGGISIELIEPFRIENPPGTDLAPNRFCGIEYNELNQPVTYTVQRVVPNPSLSQVFQYDVLDANRVEHLFVPVLPGQRRGLPLLQASIQTLASLKKIEDATLSACETAANISFLIESEYDPQNDPEQLCGVEGASTYQAFDEIKLPSRNTGLYLPSGMKASQLKAEQPNVNYKGFREDCLLSVGASLGAPKNVILNDSSSYNYSSARLDAQTFERWAGVLQSLCVPILTSHLKTFLSVMSYHPDVAMLLGSYNTLEELPIKWYFPRPEHIDRQKEASADVTLIQNNCMSLRDFYARQGKDWRAELNQIAREKRLMQELGIEPNDVIDSFGDDDESDIG